MNDRILVGTQPWLPSSLRKISWLNNPIPAERLAALRIFVGLCLLVDLLWLYLPRYADFYGPGSLAEPDVFRHYFEAPSWRWSLFHWCSPKFVMALGLAGSLGMLLGWFPRLAAMAGWAVSLSLINSNPYLHNGGDRVRTILLFILIFTPSDAAWVFCFRQPKAMVHPWWRVLLLVQMCLVYFMNGIRKLPGDEWQSGTVLHYVFNNCLWTHWSGHSLPLPIIAYKLASWFTLVWEIGFPFFLLMPITRKGILFLAAGFHLFTFLHLEVGMFAFYSLGFYVPLIPWEKWTRASHADKASHSA